jgi:hypothetical protein
MGPAELPADYATPRPLINTVTGGSALSVGVITILAVWSPAVMGRNWTDRLWKVPPFGCRSFCAGRAAQQRPESRNARHLPTRRLRHSERPSRNRQRCTADIIDVQAAPRSQTWGKGRRQWGGIENNLRRHDSQAGGRARAEQADAQPGRVARVALDDERSAVAASDPRDGVKFTAKEAVCPARIPVGVGSGSAKSALSGPSMRVALIVNSPAPFSCRGTVRISGRAGGTPSPNSATLTVSSSLATTRLVECVPAAVGM